MTELCLEDIDCLDMRGSVKTTSPIKKGYTMKNRLIKNNSQVELLKSLLKSKEQECSKLQTENERLKKSLEVTQHLFEKERERFNSGLTEIKSLRDKYEEAVLLMANTKRKYGADMKKLNESIKQ